MINSHFLAYANVHIINIKRCVHSIYIKTISSKHKWDNSFNISNIKRRSSITYTMTTIVPTNIMHWALSYLQKSKWERQRMTILQRIWTKRYLLYQCDWSNILALLKCIYMICTNMRQMAMFLITIKGIYLHYFKLIFQNLIKHIMLLKHYPIKINENVFNRHLRDANPQDTFSVIANSP